MPIKRKDFLRDRDAGKSKLVTTTKEERKRIKELLGKFRDKKKGGIL